MKAAAPAGVEEHNSSILFASLPFSSVNAKKLSFIPFVFDYNSEGEDLTVVGFHFVLDCGALDSYEPHEYHARILTLGCILRHF